MMIKKFLNISDLDKDTLEKIIFNKIPKKDLENKNIGLLFEKPSTRTRLSFIVGINKLKANYIDIRLSELNFSRDETIEDTFRAFGCYLDGLIYRTTDHNKLNLAYNIINKPIINALSDTSHPCQTLADLITLYEKFNRLNLSICWFGDMNNVLFSLVEFASIFKEIELHIFSPKIVIDSTDWKLQNNINLHDKICNDIIQNADCIMTDVFISMNDQLNKEKINELMQFQVNSKIMNLTKNDCVFMHCLPAKIGFEVTVNVIEGLKSVVWRQAYHRLTAQMRLMQCINW